MVLCCFLALNRSKTTPRLQQTQLIRLRDIWSHNWLECQQNWQWFVQVWWSADKSTKRRHTKDSLPSLWARSACCMRCFLLTNRGPTISSSSALSSLSGICRFGAEHVWDAVSRFSTATATAANDRPEAVGWLLETTSTVAVFDLHKSLASVLVQTVASLTAIFALSVFVRALFWELALKTRGSLVNTGVGLGVDDRLDNFTGAWVNCTDGDSRHGNEDSAALLEPMYTMHTQTHAEVKN